MYIYKEYMCNIYKDVRIFLWIFIENWINLVYAIFKFERFIFMKI